MSRHPADDNDENRIYDLSPPPPPPAREDDEEQLPLPVISIAPHLEPTAETPNHKQFLYGCLCSWAAAACAYASTYAPAPVPAFILIAVFLVLVGCIQWGMKLMKEKHWKHFFPGMAFGLATASFLACTSILAYIKSNW